MTLRIYNTLTREKEVFEPIEPGKVRMYVCGPTVYDRAHVGHAMSALVFDIARRYLEYSGYEVRYIMNFTDVDDKIINRANKLGKDPYQLAEQYIQDFKKNLADLNIKPATLNPRATEEMPFILEMIARLVEQDAAYGVDGDVYYRVEHDKDYGKLSGRKLETMNAGARIQVDDRKEHPMDFALWKSAKPGEPAWDSPWGKGRPGWHIECSAMNMAHLGEQIDIHGGGNDLIFPHHENEIAQSEGASGKPFARYWLHNGFVNVNQEKMSKSLGNFFTIRDILKKYDPEVVRFFILTAHYRSPIDFSDQNLEEAKAGLSRFYEALKAAGEILDSRPVPGQLTCPAIKDEERGVYDRIEALEDRFTEAMNDDFNTALAIGHLFEAVRGMNRLISENRFDECPLSLVVLRDARSKLLKLGGVLGIFASAPSDWLARSQAEGLEATGLAPEAIEQLIVERRQARQERNFARADAIRDELAAKGIELLDSKDGTSWKVK